MPKLLNVVASPRGERAASIDVATTFIEAYRKNHPGTTVDTLDLWQETLPEFGREALDAKYAGLEGRTRTPAQEQAWSNIKAVAKRFHDADVIVLGSPMWNFGIPYKLKHLIDYISQKDVMFTFDEKGFGGMLKNKRGVIVSARGISYAPASPTPEKDWDFQRAYLELWFRFVGVTDITCLTVEQTLMGPDADAREREAAKARALDEARR